MPQYRLSPGIGDGPIPLPERVHVAHCHVRLRARAALVLRPGCAGATFFLKVHKQSMEKGHEGTILRRTRLSAQEGGPVGPEDQALW